MSYNLVNKEFELLIEAIQNEQRVLGECSIQKIRAGDTEQGIAQLRLIESIKEFESKVVDLRDEWQVWLSTGGKPSSPIRRSRTGLVVKFAGGKAIKEATAAETFAQAIKEFGIDKVERLRKTANNWPLISRDKYPNPTYTQQQIDNVFIMPPSSNRDKKNLLEDIARLLKVNVEVLITSNT